MSKLEDRAVSRLKSNNLLVFTIRDLKLVAGFSQTQAYNIVKALKGKGIVKRIGKRILAFPEAHDFMIGLRLNSPSYVSFWSALNYHGLSDQTPGQVFLAARRYVKPASGFRYVVLAGRRFFGYQLEGGITVAEKEKAIIDSLLFPKYAGGIREIRRCMEAELDKAKMIDYAKKVGSKAVLRRLGYLLEELGHSVPRLDLGKGYERLDPSLPRKHNLDKRWLLDVNI